MHTKINLSDSCLYEALQIRYVKLHFTILFPEASSLPVNKVSALRGGMGEMLLRANCVRDRQCEIEKRGLPSYLKFTEEHILFLEG